MPDKKISFSDLTDAEKEKALEELISWKKNTTIPVVDFNADERERLLDVYGGDEPIFARAKKAILTLACLKTGAYTLTQKDGHYSFRNNPTLDFATVDEFHKVIDQLLTVVCMER